MINSVSERERGIDASVNRLSEATTAAWMTAIPASGSFLPSAIKTTLLKATLSRATESL